MTSVRTNSSQIHSSIEISPLIDSTSHNPHQIQPRLNFAAFSAERKCCNPFGEDMKILPQTVAI